jgi:uncharacterized protein YndB with AHSA1/START domain
MSDRSVVHSTFSLEREYPATPGRVFAAWADPAAKGRWFGRPGGEHELDFRAGGRELNRVRLDNGTLVEFESWYRDIVPDRRIVYASTLSAGGSLSTISITTIEIEPTGDGARLLLVEQGTFLDGLEEPSWREKGTGDWLDALGSELG